MKYLWFKKKLFYNIKKKTVLEFRSFTSKENNRILALEGIL